MLGNVPVVLGGAFPQWVLTGKLHLEDTCEEEDNQDRILRLLELFIPECDGLLFSSEDNQESSYTKSPYYC